MYLKGEIKIMENLHLGIKLIRIVHFLIIIKCYNIYFLIKFNPKSNFIKLIYRDESTSNSKRISDMKA